MHVINIIILITRDHSDPGYNLFVIFIYTQEAYLYNSHTQEVEVGNSSELFKQILWYKVPDSVLKLINNILSRKICYKENMHASTEPCILCTLKKCLSDLIDMQNCGY